MRSEEMTTSATPNPCLLRQTVKLTLRRAYQSSATRDISRLLSAATSEIRLITIT